MAVDLIILLGDTLQGVVRSERDNVGASDFYGFAQENTATTANPVWLIYRETANGQLRELIAASEKFDQVWDDRLILFPNPLFVNSNSIIFFGGNEHLNVGDVAELDFDGLSPFTMSAWFRTLASGEQVLLGKQGSANNAGYRMTTQVGQTRFHISGGAGANRIEIRSPSLNTDDGFWHHMAWAYDGSQTAAGVSLVFDGVDQTSSLTLQNDTLSSSSANSSSYQIGIRNNTAQDFVGFMDEPSMWTVELSVVDRQAVYNSGTPIDLLNVGPEIPDLISWWRMGDNDTFPTITDLGSGLNDATMINMISANIVGETP